MLKEKYRIIDPDPFIIAGICLQSVAVVLQLVQIAKNENLSERSNYFLNESDRKILESIDDILNRFKRSIERVEKFIQRNAGSPDSSVYEVSFRISLGILNFSAKNVREYHDNISKITSELSLLTQWIGILVSRDSRIAAVIGGDILSITGDSAGRLNRIMEKGESIGAVLGEAKLVHDSLRSAIDRVLREASN